MQFVYESGNAAFLLRGWSENNEFFIRWFILFIPSIPVKTVSQTPLDIFTEAQIYKR